MARASPPRTVQCYHCRHRFEVGQRAESTVCPGCNKAVFVGDMVVTKLKPVTRVQTCGKVVVKRSGRIIADLLEAHAGIECEGTVDVKKAVSGRLVVLGKRARWKGDLAAPALVMRLGARVGGGFFHVPDDPLELADLPR